MFDKWRDLSNILTPEQAFAWMVYEVAFNGRYILAMSDEEASNVYQTQFTYPG